MLLKYVIFCLNVSAKECLVWGVGGKRNILAINFNNGSFPKIGMC